jgi:hypothetical protein
MITPKTYRLEEMPVAMLAAEAAGNLEAVVIEPEIWNEPMRLRLRSRHSNDWPTSAEPVGCSDPKGPLWG